MRTPQRLLGPWQFNGTHFRVRKKCNCPKTQESALIYGQMPSCDPLDGHGSQGSRNVYPDTLRLIGFCVGCWNRCKDEHRIVNRRIAHSDFRKHLCMFIPISISVCISVLYGAWVRLGPALAPQELCTHFQFRVHLSVLRTFWQKPTPAGMPQSTHLVDLRHARHF